MCVITAILFMYMDIKFWLILVGLLMAALCDLQHGEVPYLITYTTLAVATGLAFYSSGLMAIIAGATVFVIFYAIYNFTTDIIGGADVVLLAASMMFYSFFDLPFFLLIISGAGLVYLKLSKQSGLRLVPVIWGCYIVQYFVTL